jgi:ABC-type glycerol-3-phosphate transport system substrate-binding protein
MRKVWTIAITVVASSITLAACSSDDSPALTNDGAIALLVERGFTPESAQCLIDGAAQQEVDVLDFLVSGDKGENTEIVIDDVSDYCTQEYGGSIVPNTSAP